MMITYTRAELLKLQSAAKTLGFWNDYNHWTKLLEELDKKEASDV